jgi:hypothetical protein
MKTISAIRPGVWRIGQVALRYTKTFTQQYEFALWYQKVECKPQIVELHFMPDGDGGHPTCYATFTGTITGNNHQACWGGVPIGKGGVDDEVGRSASYTERFPAENFGRILDPNGYDFAFDIDLDVIDIQWRPWKSAGEKEGDILYRADEPWNNLGHCFLKTVVTPHDPIYIEAKRNQAKYNLRDHPNEPQDGGFVRHWTQQREYMDRLLMKYASMPQEVS